MAKAICIKDLKFDEFFTLKDYGEQEVKENVVWVRGEYDRSSKTFSCVKFEDVNHEHFFKGNKVVYTDLYF